MSSKHFPERPINPTGEDDKDKNKEDDGKPENEKQDESSGSKSNKNKNKKDDDNLESSDDEMSYREWKAWKKEQKLKSKKKKKTSSKILIDSSDDLDSDHKRGSFQNSSKSESSRDKKKLEYHRVSHDYTFQLPSDHGASIPMG